MSRTTVRVRTGSRPETGSPSGGALTAPSSSTHGRHHDVSSLHPCRASCAAPRRAAPPHAPGPARRLRRRQESAATTAAGGGTQTLPKTIVFSNWPLYIDVNEKTKTHPSLDQFEKKYDVKVRYIEDINDNDSFFGKIEGPLSQGQSIGRDIIVLTDSRACRRA